MGTLPNKEAALVLTTIGGEEDILHVNTGGPLASNISGWIDSDGIGQGTLKAGGSVAGVASLNSATGAVSIEVDTGLAINQPNPTTIEISPALVAGSGISIQPVGSTLQVSNTSTGNLPAIGPSPWIDVSTKGARTFVSNIPAQSTTATTNSGSPNVTLAAAIDFQNGDGIVIHAAGSATAQSTPSAPTVVSPPVQGALTVRYQVVGVDSFGGLTAASPVGSTAVAPSVFGNLPVQIANIARSSNVITVNFQNPINAVAGEQIAIINVTGDTTMNGVFNIVSAPTTSQITYSSTGSDGSGTVSASSTGRLTNTLNISAISRSGNTVTVTTNVNHNYHVQAGNAHTLVIISGVTQADFNGIFVIATVPTANSFTYVMGLSKTFTPTISGGETCTVYEYNTVTCPAYSGTTSAYYIYSDRGSGGTLNLIGKTLPNTVTYTDYGSWITGQFSCPAYVPSTPPVAAQDQLFVSTIVSGAGTTNLILNNNVTSTVSGAKTVHDNSIALVNAAAIASAAGGGTVYIPPSTSNIKSYLLSYPFSLPSQVSLILAGPLTCDETFSFAANNDINTNLGAAPTSTQQFGTKNYVNISGKASPQMLFSGSDTSLQMDGLQFNCGGNNGTYGLVTMGVTGTCVCTYSNLSGVSSNSSSNAIPFVFQGSVPGAFLNNINCFAFGVITQVTSNPNGKQFASPPNLPGIWLKALDSGVNIGQTPTAFTMGGINNLAGRGILLDFSQNSFSSNNYTFIIDEDQAATTPALMVYGGGSSGTNITATGITVDSAAFAPFANWGGNCAGTILINCDASGGASLVTGTPLLSLTVINPQVGQPIGQNSNVMVYRSDKLNSVNYLGNVAPQLFVSFPIVTSSEIACQYPLITGVTASSSGGGTFPANNYSVQITSVGWNNGAGESQPSDPVFVTLNGSQGVSIGWTASSVPVQGYNVYMLGLKQNLTPVTTNSFTASSRAVQGFIGSLDGTGLPVIDSTQVATPLLRLALGLNKVDMTPVTLTANRTCSVPNGNSFTALGASLTSTAAASDAVTVQGATSSSFIQVTPTNSAAALDIGAGNVYVSAKGTNSVTISHSATSGMTFDIYAIN